MLTHAKLTGLALALTLSLSQASCTFVTEKLNREDSYAKEIESTVTNGLRIANDVNAAPISVEYANEQIVLEGFVGSDAESVAAEATARRFYPEFEIVNKLVVP